MKRISIIQLPSIALGFVIITTLLLQWFFLLPLWIERERDEAVRHARIHFAHDLEVIQNAVRSGEISRVKAYISASSSDLGVVRLMVVGSNRKILVASNIELENQSIDTLPEREQLQIDQALDAAVSPDIMLNSKNNMLEVFAKVRFPETSSEVPVSDTGLVYLQKDLQVIMAPTERTFLIHISTLTLLLLGIGLPVQLFLYFSVGRRLQRVARDISSFSEGKREGLFSDNKVDEIGVISEMLRNMVSDEDQFKVAFESIPIPYIIINKTGVIQRFNRAAEKTFGYQAEEVLEKNISILMPEPHRSKHDQYMGRYDTGSESTVVGMGREMVALRKDGSEFSVHLSVAETILNHERAFIGSMVDLTELKTLQQQLNRSQKMDAVGRLTGGIAHDFNNILQVIRGFTQLVIRNKTLDLRGKEDLDQVNLATQKGAHLVSRLLAFGRCQVIELESLLINDCIMETCKMLRRVVEQRITVKFHPGAEVKWILADRTMIDQVLMNLCINARDAMTDIGTIVISTKLVSGTDELKDKPADCDSEKYVLMSVADDGNGMDQETLERCIEPFFTSKKQSEGSGLGLATVYGIIRQHKGWLTVESRLGEGSQFNLFWPTSEKPALDVLERIQDEPEGGKETILFAEDDENVHRITKQILSDAGYTVLGASDGEEAVALFTRNRDSVDLLLFDAVMPAKGGFEAYEEIRRHSPHVPILFASGYHEKLTNSKEVLKNRYRVIAKPFYPEALLREVREVLDAKPTQSS